MIQSMTRRKRNGDLATHVFVCAPDEGDDLVWDSVVPQQLPQYLSIHAVKGFLVVNKTDVRVEFHSIDCSTMMRRLVI